MKVLSNAAARFHNQRAHIAPLAALIVTLATNIRDKPDRSDDDR